MEIIRKLDEESNQLPQEQGKYESTKLNCKRDCKQVRESPRDISKDSLGRDHAMQRHAHY